MEINEKFLKIGKIPVRTPMELDGSAHITVHGEENQYHFRCVKIEEKTNNDGTKDLIYVLKHDPFE